MLLSSFPIVIPYTLIGINHLFSTKPSDHSSLKDIRTLDAYENDKSIQVFLDLTLINKIVNISGYSGVYSIIFMGFGGSF